MITQSFDLNLIPEQEPVVVHCDQYDTGEGRLVATLYDGDMVYTPSGTATIQGTKPDGHGFSYSATISGSTVSADLTEQMSIVYGDVRCQFVISETDGRTGTFVFILRVQKSALPDNSDMSESEYQAIEEAVNACNQAAINAQGYAEDSEESAEDSEAWAVGQRNGVDVPSTDPTYHNNSKYWASQANVTSLGALSDVTLSSPTNGEALVYDGEKWVNGDNGEDLLKDTVGWTGKNLLDLSLSEIKSLNTGGSWEGNAWSRYGMTLTVNDDMTISVAGTSTDTVIMILKTGSFNNCILNGCPSDGSSSSYKLSFFRSGNSYEDYGAGVLIENGLEHEVRLVVYSGQSFTTPKVFYPMIRKASIIDSSYEPYHESVDEVKYNRSEANILGAKNLNASKYVTNTDNGITYTPDSDGAIVVSGTASGVSYNKSDAIYRFTAPFTAQVVLSGGATGVNLYAYDYTLGSRPYKDDTMSELQTESITDANGQISFYMQEGHSLLVNLSVNSGTNLTTPVTVYPMLRLASDPDSTYQPHAMTNRQLTEELADVYTSLSAKLNGRLFGTTTTADGTTVSFSNITTTKSYMLMADYASDYNGALVGISNVLMNGTTITYTVTNATVGQTFALIELN